MNQLFDELFVLELANNHWGSVERGLAIIDAFSKIARCYNIRCAIKLQFRNVESFIHTDFKTRQDIRYIKKTMDTQLSNDQLAILVNAIRENNCIPMATPFDEASVKLCESLNLPIIKIASSDINDWPLLEEIAKLKKPVIASTGGSSLKDMDDIVHFFTSRNIPIALNHCIALYPSESSQLELNQIDFLKQRYPNITIGFSSHEYQDWRDSMMIAYAKGARTFERHIDLDLEDHPRSPYCSNPTQIDIWFKAFQDVKDMCGGEGTQKIFRSRKEVDYLDNLVRGIYAKHDLKKGSVLTFGDYYLAIPLQKGQLSCRELTHNLILTQDILKDQKIQVQDLNIPLTESFKERIMNRGI